MSQYIVCIQSNQEMNVFVIRFIVIIIIIRSSSSSSSSSSRSERLPYWTSSPTYWCRFFGVSISVCLFIYCLAWR